MTWENPLGTPSQSPTGLQGHTHGGTGCAEFLVEAGDEVAFSLRDSIGTESACLVKSLTWVLFAYVNTAQNLESPDVASVYLLKASSRGTEQIIPTGSPCPAQRQLFSLLCIPYTMYVWPRCRISFLRNVSWVYFCSFKKPSKDKYLAQRLRGCLRH